MTKQIVRCILFIATYATVSIAVAQEYQPFTRLGTSEAVCKPGIETREDLQSFFATNPEIVNEILTSADWSGDSASIFEAIKSGDFTEKNYQPGNKFEWTSSKKKGVGTALAHRVWQGDYAFEGFELNIESNCKVHKLVIPKACCNLSLATSVDVNVIEPNIKITSEYEQVTICSDVGNVVNVSKSDGTNERFSLDTNGCWTGVLQAGTIFASVENQHQCGLAESSVTHNVIATPVVKEAIVEKVAEPAFDKGFLPFVGIFAGSETRMRLEPAWQKDYQDEVGVVGVKVGVIKPINPSLSFFTQLGFLDRGEINNRLADADDTIFIDVGMDKNLGATGFIGGGVGLWNIGDDEFDDVSAFVHGGSSFGASNAQWYIEGRVFADDIDDIEDNNLISGGIRYLFK